VYFFHDPVRIDSNNRPN